MHTMLPNILSMALLTSNLTEKQRKQLCGLMGNVKLTLLYKASVHGYQASAFHQRCDRQGPTLLVAYNRSGYTFGGYTSVDYAQSGQQITDETSFMFSFQGGAPVRFNCSSDCYARYDDAGGPNFGEQFYFCYNNQPVVYDQGRDLYFRARVKAFNFHPATLYGNDTQLSECEVYKVEQIPQISAKIKPWRNVLWTAKRRAELMDMIRKYKPIMTSVSQIRILMIGPVGAGKSSFFNSINSIFMGRITSKAMSGSAGTSLTTQFRTYPVKDGREGKPLPFVLCDTMGLEEQSGAGLDIEDISSILQGHIPDRYKFNPTSTFQPNEQKASRPASLQEKIHCVVYVIDTTKISLMSDKLQEKLTTIRRKVNSLAIPQMVLMTKVDEACPEVEKDLQSLYVSSYIKSKVQEVSSRLGVPVSCVLPVKNYSQELELELNCDVLLLTALQQMLNFADDYLDDVGPM
ncbi:interferon-induced protein 44-like isoform X1 [Labeo rohita]|nr:interferon-induced protein 44-like isoform X1 [Labeo rohita]XP_050951349.1 interferon-induced protein 44-like isoform X1 [Labeo rohita]XP_050951350.1 interferon-induced protein 44-like isoform X1 [Labeo rohita]XP_050951351.1 interferon-induced protein 44-like isoform X1 [Labeo rohita]XP_050951352.1 interferon-induced protein 44-like isoform X1 [Labeo rohita]XP_050951353.1 interferon-induced protein 44-like isoform X1 [Labeo rohita]